MKRWIWIEENVVRAIHQAQLAEHGGAGGFINEGLLLSALAHPKNLFAYGKSPDSAALGAAYGFAITRNHPFADGNKRTAFVVMELFLELNHCPLIADDAECIETMESLAAGTMTETQLSEWVRGHLQKRRLRGKSKI